ncbi:unnamed protein product, partial [Staurois parvus]
SALQRDFLFLYPAGALSSGFCSVGTGHDSRVPSAHAQEAVLFVNGKAVPGTHDRSQKPPDQSQSASASRSCALGTRLSYRAPLQKPGRQRAAGSRNR